MVGAQGTDVLGAALRVRERLEELDGHKKGMSEVSRNARQASRFLDEMVSKLDNIEEGVPLGPHSHNAATGRLFLQTQAIDGNVPVNLPTSKVDNQILGVVLFLAHHHPKRQVINVDNSDSPVSVTIRPGLYNPAQLAAEVERDWRATRREDLLAARMAALIGRYEIALPDLEEAAALAAAGAATE